jgi:hypothetical protein
VDEKGEKETRRKTMNPILRSSALLAAIASAATAGVINVIQLGSPDVVRFEVKCGDVSQPFELAHGGSTGRFVLPETEAAVLSLPNRETKSLSIPATKQPHIAVLTVEGDKDVWKLIPGKPTDDKWSLRAINISSEAAVFEKTGKPLEIAAGATVGIPVAEKEDIALQPKGGEMRAYDGREPCAVVALLYRKEGAWQVLFVPDR